MLSASAACLSPCTVLVRVWLTGRDLNTNNVLVYSIAYGTLNVRIADFGLSREMAKDTSMTGYLGSPSYIAPEVLTDSAVYDETVDVYSYGIILWALIKFLAVADLAVRPDKATHRRMMSPYPGNVPVQHRVECSATATAAADCVVAVGGAEMSPWQIVARVKEGMRPQVPRGHAAPVLESLMRDCWSQAPSTRPPFSHILDRLEEDDMRLQRPEGLGDVYREPTLPGAPPLMSRVAPQLFVGGLGGIRSSMTLRTHKVSHVLNVAGRVRAGVCTCWGRPRTP